MSQDSSPRVFVVSTKGYIRNFCLVPDIRKFSKNLQPGVFPQNNLKQFIERFHAEPGQGLKEYGLQTQNSNQNYLNADYYKSSISEFIRLYNDREWSYSRLLLEKGKITENELDEIENSFTENRIPKIGDLLRKSRYYLINVHPIGQYSVTENEENQEDHLKRIVNIGGIENEMEDFIKNNPQIIEHRQEDVPESSSQSGGYFPRNEEENKWIYKVYIFKYIRAGPSHI